MHANSRVALLMRKVMIKLSWCIVVVVVSHLCCERESDGEEGGVQRLAGEDGEEGVQRAGQEQQQTCRSRASEADLRQQVGSMEEVGVHS